jgi:hypothetical protein
VLGYDRVQIDAPIATAPPQQTASEGTQSFNLGTFSGPGVGPWSVKVSWGDGSADTTSFVGSTGSLGAQSHQYEEGDYVVTVTVTAFTGQSSDPITFPVTVMDQQLTIGPSVPVSAVEGAGCHVLATFHDPAGNEPNLADPGGTTSDHYRVVWIDWGDSTPLDTMSGEIVLEGGTVGFLVQGTHAYKEEGTYSYTVRIQHENLPVIDVPGTVTVSDPPVTAVAGSGPVVVNGSFEAVQIGVLTGYESDFGCLENIPGWTHTGMTDGDGPLWNDGFGGGSSILAGAGHQFVTMGGGTNLTEYSAWDQMVPGFIPGHTYTLTFKMSSEGMGAVAQSITVSIPNDSAVTPQTFTAPASTAYWRNWVSKSITFTAANQVEDIQFSANTRYDVGLDDVSITDTTPFVFTEDEGTLSPLQTLATFKDPGGPELNTSGHYRATVDWGDGHTTLGVINYDPVTQLFTVQRSHTYAEERDYPILVTIRHDNGLAPDTTVSCTAHVNELPLIVTGNYLYKSYVGTPPPWILFPASALIQTVASFTDPGGPEPNPSDPDPLPNHYSATIDWGNGPEPGTVTYPNVNGVFRVIGSHHYPDTLTRQPIIVQIFQEGTTATGTSFAIRSQWPPSPLIGGVSNVTYLPFPNDPVTPPGPGPVGHMTDVTVEFVEPVFVTGAPLLILNSGGTARYSGGSGSDILTFTYVVGAGEFSSRLDYTSTSALSLNGGTIIDANGLDVDLTLPAPGQPGSLGANAAIAIDGITPVVPTALVDDSGWGFSTRGLWSLVSGGYNGNYRRNAGNGDGEGYAQWQYAGAFIPGTSYRLYYPELEIGNGASTASG